jgi:hypothetical protein
MDGRYQPTHETHPRRSIAQWLKSHPLYAWLAAAYQDTRWSARQIEPFVRKHHIDMARLTASSHRGVDERPGTVVRGGVALRQVAPRRPAGLRPGSLVQSANGHQLGRPDVWTSNARLGSVALLVLCLGGKGEPFYSQIAVEVPIFCMIMEAFCTLKTFGRLGPIRFAYRVETPRNQGPGHSTQCG